MKAHGINGDPKPKPPTRLVIERTPEGRYSVTGPIDNPELAYAMLGIARDVIAHRAQSRHGDSRKSDIVVPRLSLE